MSTYCFKVSFTLEQLMLLMCICQPVSSGQPIGVMFTLIMGSNAGGFGLVSLPWLFVRRCISDFAGYSVVH
jgi:hypothetical protein